MNQSKSWSYFILALGLLTICYSPSATGNGTIDQPLFFGGVIISLFGLFMIIRDRKR